LKVPVAFIRRLNIEALIVRILPAKNSCNPGMATEDKIFFSEVLKNKSF